MFFVHCGDTVVTLEGAVISFYFGRLIVGDIAFNFLTCFGVTFSRLVTPQKVVYICTVFN